MKQRFERMSSGSRAQASRHPQSQGGAVVTNDDVSLDRQGIASTQDRVKTLSDRQVHDLAQRCRLAAIEKKAENVVLLDIRGRANFADYFVIASGRSAIQVRAIADAVVEASELRYGAPVRTEGYNDGGWVLVDYGAVIVHVFTPAAREFYDLERLWAKPVSAYKKRSK